ncbi:hypothetical protein [Levyella massiliensis]|uniref:hypothetical protein n=1 Tax=Levyella massiliensis TaxID=938289 RepID=UPI00035E9A3D
MSKLASKIQEKVMSFLFRGKEIFKPLNTGYIDERVSCIREYAANIYLQEIRFGLGRTGATHF